MSTAQQRADVIEAATRMFWYIDTGDWDEFPSVFADQVVLDYTAIWGGEPVTATPDGIRRDWSTLLGAFDATQHLLGNHLVHVDGHHAELTAVFQAIHLLANRFGSPRWTLGGTYRIGLTDTGNGWLIDTVVMTPTWADGNKEVLTLAAAGSVFATP
ncbi:nuclear transport factor 2 family protein [Nocardia blacklockiae]|uniref:nuclear transport factor 2 family protein n=1 Tax=Nocardia blacklockiae TaxID=480036 RepID=UPI001892E3A6|nr:nuclear transport factor 2 family protein [Nocardia blacklockiae]MBF6175188.1 nuclear transport factor 2 family protein [Nocardia blacklockiae]